MQYCYQQTWINYEEPKLFDNPGWPRRFPRRGINFDVERFSQQIQITGSSTRLNSCIVPDCAEDIVHCARLCWRCCALCSLCPIVLHSIFSIHFARQRARALPNASPSNITEYFRTLPNVTKHSWTLPAIEHVCRTLNITELKNVRAPRTNKIFAPRKSRQIFSDKSDKKLMSVFPKGVNHTVLRMTRMRQRRTDKDLLRSLCIFHHCSPD